MALVSLTNATFDYGREKILRGVNLALHPGVKCALVGANGAGKTTLLSALSGTLELQDGSRQVMGRASIRLLRQETSLTVDGTLGGTVEACKMSAGGHLLETVAASAFARELLLENQLAEISAELETARPDRQVALVKQQGILQSDFERLNGYSVKSRQETAMLGVGLFPETWDRPVEKLSGGERRRAALAAVLLSNADLLLLDEPTNHLDLESCELLENFLDQYPGAAIIVSHDRHFLDRVAQRTLHLDRGKLVSYRGNYSFFDEQSALRFEQDLNAWERQQNKIKITEDYIRRNIEGQKTKQAQARRKQLAKEEKLERPSTEPGLFRFQLTPVRPSGGTVLQTENLGKSFDEQKLLHDFEMHISRGERIGIVGPNGCGKSTLLKMMAGRLVPDMGRVVIGHNVDLGFYDQELASVSDHNTVLAEMQSVDPVATLGELRSFLGAFGFGEDLFDRQVARLSGGERGRLALMRLIKEGHNTLLLDEPTNHLDIRSRESLEAALIKYSGTLIVVSHDRRFLNKIVDKLVVFPAANDSVGRAEGRTRIFLGNYEDFSRQKTLEKAQEQLVAGATIRKKGADKPSEAESTASNGRTPLSKNEQKRREKLIEKAESSILTLEEEKGAAITEMTSPDLGNERRLVLGKRCVAIDKELEEHLAQWEQWSLEIEEGI